MKRRFREVLVVLDAAGQPIHTSTGGVAHIPDRAETWTAIWNAHLEGRLAAVAHTHPGTGVPRPSSEDVTTMDAVEAGLGRALTWLIASADQVAVVRGGPWTGGDGWVAELRKRSWRKS
jgi:proteasome lid subunit RPN8/RPN11